MHPGRYRCSSQADRRRTYVWVPARANPTAPAEAGRATGSTAPRTFCGPVDPVKLSDPELKACVMTDPNNPQNPNQPHNPQVPSAGSPYQPGYGAPGQQPGYGAPGQTGLWRTRPAGLRSAAVRSAAQLWPAAVRSAGAAALRVSSPHNRVSSRATVNPPAATRHRVPRRPARVSTALQGVSPGVGQAPVPGAKPAKNNKMPLIIGGAVVLIVALIFGLDAAQPWQQQRRHRHPHRLRRPPRRAPGGCRVGHRGRAEVLRRARRPTPTPSSPVRGDLPDRTFLTKEVMTAAVQAAPITGLQLTAGRDEVQRRGAGQLHDQRPHQDRQVLRARATALST